MWFAGSFVEFRLEAIYKCSIGYFRNILLEKVKIEVIPRNYEAKKKQLL